MAGERRRGAEPRRESGTILVIDSKAEMLRGTFDVDEAIFLIDDEAWEAVNEVCYELPADTPDAERFDAVVAELARRIRKRKT